MLKNITGTYNRKEEVIRLGIEGKTTLSEVADAWGCSAKNIVDYLHRIQEEKKYAFLVDGNGYFRFFKDF